MLPTAQKNYFKSMTLPVNRFTGVETATRLVNRTCAVNRTNEVSYSPRSSRETDENILAK